MKLTREKRPDKVECRWNKYVVELCEDGDIYIYNGYSGMFIRDKNNIKQLLKALQIILDSK